MVTETWYILEDDTVGDPRECTADADGNITHKSGKAVKTGPYGYRTRSVDPEAERAKAAPKRKPTQRKTRNMAPEDGGSTYRTRESKPE